MNFAPLYGASKAGSDDAMMLGPDFTALDADRLSIDRAGLQTLFVVRGIAIGGQTIALAFASVLPDAPLPLIALATISLLFVIASLLALERIRRKSATSDHAF